MHWMRKVVALAVAATMVVGITTGCQSNSSNGKASEIYFLNFKPEIASKYNAIAAAYQKETGVKVKVVTAASNTYEQTLQSEIAKSDAPSIFEIDGPVGYQNWKSYTANLADSKLYSYLSDKSLAVKSGSGVYGIPYTLEGYGIIYNDAIMKKYFALPDKAVSINATTDIKDFATLKSVVEDMTAKKSELGIQGVFGSTSLASGEDWRWQTHLANIPFYYEFKQKGSDTVDVGLKSKTVSFEYSQNFKNIFDLYTNNSDTSKSLLGSKTVADSMSEFALGKVAMIQNGNWAWTQINSVAGNVVNSSDVKFLPIYTGVSGEQNQGICIGSENYFCINNKVSKAEQQASLDFLDWLFSSKEGKSDVINQLGFIVPFNTFSSSEVPSDPLSQQVLQWENDKNVTNVPWTFESFPNQSFKNDFGAALLQYCQGKENWDQVTSTVINSWKNEKANASS